MQYTNTRLRKKTMNVKGEIDSYVYIKKNQERFKSTAYPQSKEIENE